MCFASRAVAAANQIVRLNQAVNPKIRQPWAAGSSVALKVVSTIEWLAWAPHPWLSGDLRDDGLVRPLYICPNHQQTWAAETVLGKPRGMSLLERRKRRDYSVFPTVGPVKKAYLAERAAGVCGGALCRVGTKRCSP